jgi:hypothetical protein
LASSRTVDFRPNAVVDAPVDSWSKIRKQRLEKNFAEFETINNQQGSHEEEIRKAKEFYRELGKSGFSECLNAYIVTKRQIKRHQGLGLVIEDDLMSKFCESESSLHLE